MNKKIVIGSRGSKLALIYAQTAKNKIVQNTDLNDEDIIIKEITTKGDQVQDKRLSEVGGKGLFSTNIENELLYLKGSIPGSKNSEVMVKKSVKNISKMTIGEKQAAAEEAKKTPEKKKK